MKGHKKKAHTGLFKNVLIDLIKSNLKINYEEARFLHFEQQNPTRNLFFTGLAEKEHFVLFGFVFLMNSPTFAEAFLKQFEQQTP